MKRNNNWLFIVLLMALSVFFLSSGNAIAAIDGGYEGTAFCLGCHDGGTASDKTSFVESGHSYKFRQTNGADCGAGACDAISNILPTPDVTTIDTISTTGTVDYTDAGHYNLTTGDLPWADIDAVIGGWGWKARFTMVEGYVWSGTGVQWNALVGTWGGYHAGENKQYNCSRCHNTNGTRDLTQTRAIEGEYFSDHTYDGVQCEGCHANSVRVENGDNSSNATAHGADPIANAMGIADAGVDVDGNGTADVNDMCGRCHNRDTDDEPNASGAAAKGGFIRHHEQYDELVGVANSGVHAALVCTDCHDPHVRSHKVPAATATALGITDNALSAEARGAVVSCGSCHPGHESSNNALMNTGHAAVMCIDCHMGEATKSATAATGTWGKQGDVKTHIFKIDPAIADTAAGTVALGALSVEYACGKCHDLGSATTLTRAEAVTAIGANYHKSYTAGEATAAEVETGYVGSAVCGTCHVSNYNDFLDAGHSYKFRQTNGVDCSDGVSCDAISNILPTPDVTTIDTISTTGTVDYTDAGHYNLTTGDLDWADIDAVIGGWGWKARFTMTEGYVWSGTGVQWNALVGTWGGYHAGENKQYNCSRCHNTNGTRDLTQTRAIEGQYFSDHTFDGVQCEGCHADSVRVENGVNNSEGVNHMVDPQNNPMPIADAGVDVDGNGTADVNDMCGRCHNRDTDDEPNASGAAAKGGFIRHHEQYDELVGVANSGVHAALVCTDCHDVHKRSHKVPDATATALGITDNALSAEARGAVVSCESCHTTTGLSTGLVAVHVSNDVACIDCHMAEATKSATAESGTFGKRGDVKSHIFAIDPAGADTAGGSVALGALSLNYACGKCHDSSMSTYVGFALTEAELAIYAEGAHGQGTGAGTSTATYARFNWYQGAGCYQVNFDGSDNDSTCDWVFPGGTPATSSDCVVSTVFDSAGTKSVTLTTAGGTRTMAVTAKAVNALPDTGMTVAANTAYDASGMNLLVTDASSANACDASTALTAVVVWGDGTTTLAAISEGGAVGSHTYSVPGTYTISYSTRDSSGNKAFSAPQTWTVPDAATSVCDVEGNIAGITPDIGTKITLKEGMTVVKLGQTDVSGNYSIPNVQAGRTYDIIPSRNGWEFSDTVGGNTTISLSPLDCTPVTGNSTGNDFTANGIW